MLTRRLTCHLRAEMLCKMLAALIWQLCISLPARLAPHATPASPTACLPDESEYKINICPPYMFVTYRLAPRSFPHIIFYFYFSLFPNDAARSRGHIMILCMTKYKILLQSLLRRNKRSRISNLSKVFPKFCSLQ